MGKLNRKAIEKIEREIVIDLTIEGHDAIVEATVEAVRKVDKEVAVSSFVDSLPNRTLYRRAILGAYAVARKLEVHPLDETPGLHCAYCGLYSTHSIRPDDLSFTNSERHETGASWFDRIEHTCRLILLFLHDDEDPSTFSDEGYPILRRILEIAASLPPNGKLSDLVKQMRGVLPSNEEERRGIIETLGVCGILQPEGHPSWLDRFITSREKNERKVPYHWNSWRYPVQWWRGKDGVNGDAVRFWFPKLEWDG